MSFEIYELMHFAGLGLLISAIGGLLVVAGSPEGRAHRLRRPFMIGHGLGATLMLVAGFGMMARLNIHIPVPEGWAWIYGKFAVWLSLALIIIPIRRAPQAAVMWWLVTVGLMIGGATLAVLKPF